MYGNGLTRLLAAVLPILDQVIHDRRVGQGGGITDLIRCPFADLAQDTAHDLARARLRQPRRFLYEVGLRERPDLLAHCSNNLMNIINQVEF